MKLFIFFDSLEAKLVRSGWIPVEELMIGRSFGLKCVLEYPVRSYAHAHIHIVTIGCYIP